MKTKITFTILLIVIIFASCSKSQKNLESKIPKIEAIASSTFLELSINVIDTFYVDADTLKCDLVYKTYYQGSEKSERSAYFYLFFKLGALLNEFDAIHITCSDLVSDRKYKYIFPRSSFKYKRKIIKNSLTAAR
jgi:hypothetical protein